MGIHHSYSQLFEFLSFLVTNDVKKSRRGYHGSIFFKCWNSMLLEPRNALVLHILSAYTILSSMSIHFPEYVVSLWGVQKLLTNLDGNIIPCITIHIPWMFAALVSWRERCDLISFHCHLTKAVVSFSLPLTLQESILHYNTRYNKRWNFEALHHYFTEVLDREESSYFFASVLPGMVQLALELPNICTQVSVVI